MQLTILLYPNLQGLRGQVQVQKPTRALVISPAQSHLKQMVISSAYIAKLQMISSEDHLEQMVISTAYIAKLQMILSEDH